MLAVLDANVLYPFQLRNFLLHLAAVETFQPLWSDEIIEETRRNLLKNGVVSPAKWDSLEKQLRKHFSDAWGRGFESRIADLTLPDPDDRHVLALAVHYEADVIVTYNTKDFPRKVLEPLGLERMRPPSFVDQIWKKSEATVLEAAELHRLSPTKAPLSRPEYLTQLRDRAQLRRVADRLEKCGFLTYDAIDQE